jgi:hypothetical protein
MSDPILQGETAVLTSYWTDTATPPVPIDPVVTVLIVDPSGDQSSPIPTNPAVGTFEVLLDVLEAGIYDGEWIGETVNGIRKCKFQICVEPSVFAGVS